MAERIRGAGILVDFLRFHGLGFRARAGADPKFDRVVRDLNRELAEVTLTGGRTGTSKGDIRRGFSLSRDRLSEILIGGRQFTRQELLQNIEGRTRRAGTTNQAKDIGYLIFNTNSIARGHIEQFLGKGFVFEDFGRIYNNTLPGNLHNQRREAFILRGNLISGRDRDYRPPPPPPPVEEAPPKPSPPPEVVQEEQPQQEPEPVVHLWSRDGTQFLILTDSPKVSNMANQKQYTIKIFNQDGSTFLSNIAPDEIAATPTFNSRINGGFSEMKINLRGDRFKFDSFSEGTNVDFLNIVTLTVIDEDNPRGRTIYKGWISQYEPYIDPQGNEGVLVTVMHLTSLLSASYYKNGSNFTVSHSADDAETIGRAIVDHFNTIFSGSLLSYSGDTTDPVGVNLTYDFVDQKWFDALVQVGKMAGESWWWKIDETGQYWLKDKPASSTHTFTVGKDIQMIRAVKTAERIINDVQVRYDGGNYDASDATSQQTYGTGSGTPTGKWSNIVSDTNLKDLTTATERGDKEVADDKDAKIMASITLNNNYDLESIKAGETCKIRNFAKDNSFFNDNMLIASVNYNGDTVTVQLSDEPVNFALELDEFVNG